MGSDSKSKKKKDSKSDKSLKSDKSKSKSKDKDSKSPSKKQKKQKQTKSKKPSKIKDEPHSDVSSILPTAPPAADCVHHKSPFIYYCETCEELICNQCTVYGPHNNHLHRILKITDAYRSRVFYLSEAIRSNLVDKRDKIIAQLHRLQYRTEQIRFVKNIIGRDIRSQYSGIIERLKNSEGVRLANLSHEVALAQRQIDTINDLGNTFFELTSLEDNLPSDQEKKICKFLSKSKQMYEAIEYLLNKPERHLPEVKHEELPRQIDENRSLLQKALAAKQINDFKNQVVWNLATDLKDQEKNIRSEVDVKANMMIRDLGQQAEKMNSRLQSLKMICRFCGIRMSNANVNGQCEKNQGKEERHEEVKTMKAPNENYYGNGRHFFSRKMEQAVN